MQTYLTQTKFNTHKYQRRVPQQLLELVNTTYFRVSLGADTATATATAIQFNTIIDEALQLVNLNLPKDIIRMKLDKLVPTKATTKQKEGADKGEPKEAGIKEGLFLSIVSNYLASQKDNISADETRDKTYFYNSVCTAIFKHIGLATTTLLITDITYSHLLEFKEIISKLPKRNIQKYRSMEVADILKILDEIPIDDLLSARTVNKYIKWLRALFNFAHIRGIVKVNLPQAIPIVKTIDDRLQRLPLDESELNILLKAVPQQMQYLLQILAYTGMRLSELYKCKIETIEGYKCFSLMNRNIKLKTKSSYRIIPIHKSLLDNIKDFELHRSTISSDTLARTASDTIKKLKFKDMNKKSLYSLRHRFATRLIQKGADSSIVSELMGHSHTTMTLNRYSTGYSITQLHEVIYLL